MTHTLVAEIKPEVALADLGVRPELVSAEGRRRLDVDGFVVLEDVFGDDQARSIRERIDEALDAQLPDRITDAEARRRATRRVELFDRALRSVESSSEPPLEDAAREQSEQTWATMKRTADALRAALATDDLPVLRTLGKEEFGGGADFIEYDLVEIDPFFDLVLQSPRVLSTVAYVLGPMLHLSTLALRRPHRGGGQQPLHRVEHGSRRMVTTIWLIDDMTLDNGPTRIVPGSHLDSRGLSEEMERDPTRTHPCETKLCGRAGSVVVFDDHTWHGGSIHQGGGPRRVVICLFGQRSLTPAISLYRPEKTLARLSPGQRWMLHPELEERLG
jgi:ectoine hydroxylase-related dioxygenase (phytanoyl-CoA dioxygenase family)